ncbi:tetratricopeptide repeat protein [Pseudoxanthomonas composti]|uniref:Tetratricopeptide repeat protein n=1 Tax=Pseudoxanthomonas composti TaxID=2137479 RepID=A0A4Q1JWL0_9GAMM|nr:tetratricopeptide repeat protein [Pseudoxanthomonas composti]RXR07001.1 tetratricopeptide repeat protein [Pseudoxanthomonas composti]
MGTFIAIAVVVGLLVLVGVLWPLWRGERKLMLGCLLLLAIGVGLLYRLVGTPQALAPQSVVAEAPQDLDQAIAQLRAALQRKPNEPEGWRLLGRALAAREDLDQSRQAFAKAAELAPTDANILTEAAQARMLASPDRRLDAQAVALLQRALQAQPNHERARWFLGVAQRQAGQPAAAADTWAPLLEQVQGNTRASLLEQVNLARQEAQLPPLQDSAAPAADSAHAVTVQLALAPGIAESLPADASVFVIARVPGGPPMPVAVEKHPLSALPLTVTLDDADSPMPTQRLSALGEVEVLARVSVSGNAMAQPGDLSTAPLRVTLPAQAPVKLVIGQAP